MPRSVAENPVSASVPGQEDNLAPGQLARQKAIRRIPKRSLDLDPSLPAEALDVVQSAATNDSNSILDHKVLLC